MKKILIVDDEPHIIMLVASRLRANGYEIITASDGEEGLKMIVSEKPDLVVLDLMMPKMDGYSVLIALKEMRQIKDDVPDMPIIVLTAKVDAKIKELVQKEQVSGYILKPFESQWLLDSIKKALE